MDKKEITSTHEVAPGLCLFIEKLWAEVNISVGEEGKATVEISGDEKFLKDIHVTQPNPKLLQIEGAGSNLQGNSVTVISSGGRGYVSVSSLRGGCIIVGGGNIVVNGKSISGDGNVNVIEGGDIPKIKVAVPKGTNLESYDVERVKACGLKGSLSSHVSGQGSIHASDVNGLKMKCSGQSSCDITAVSGDAKLVTAGQSSIDIQGDLNEVDADASGQSHITINGNCHDFEGEASGQSRILLSGKATGRIRQRESGQSRVVVH